MDVGGLRRRPVIGVSLKMYMDVDRTLTWSQRVAELACDHEATSSGHVELFILPSLPALGAVVGAVRGAPVAVGAQDLFWEDRGPYTGAVSGSDLRAIGCRYVEVGHAERRRLFGDDDQAVQRKVTAAVRNGLTPVVCVGETQRGGPGAAATCVRQLAAALGGMDPTTAVPVVVAYEPEWAIGAQRSATPHHVTGVAGALRAWLDERPHLAGSRLVYGGSAGPGLLTALDGAVDGLFLGRSAHDPDVLVQVLDEAAGVR